MLRRDLLLLCCLAALSLGCIVRPVSARDQRAKFDRSGLSEVLFREVPGAATRANIVFGDDVQLAGAEWSPYRPKPGDQVQVTFWYRVLDEAEEDYKVFVHVDDHGGRSERINGDHWAAGGRYPLKMWQRGEVIKDTFTFHIPGHHEGTSLDVWTGFYPPGKDDRWPISNKQDVHHDGQNRALAVSIPMQR